MTATTNFRLTEDDLSALEAHRVALGAPNATAALRMLLHGPQPSPDAIAIQRAMIARAQSIRETAGQPIAPLAEQTLAALGGTSYGLKRPNLAPIGSRAKQPRGKK